jgi:hypothetical protein
VRQKEQESQNHLPVEITTMTASNPSSFPPVTMSETQVLISSPSPPVSVVTIRSETPELPTPETGQWVKENGGKASLIYSLCFCILKPYSCTIIYDPFQCSIGVVGFCIRFDFQSTQAEEVCRK